jgi:hypothetical protein
MADGQPNGEPEPQILLRQRTAQFNGVTKYWSIGWEVENRGAAPLKIAAIHLPHGQFKADRQKFEPAIDLDSGAIAQMRTQVRCEEPPGLVTENAFVIFHVSWLDQPWRIFVRIRVTINSKGEPETATELMTTQKVGFSGVTS